MTDAQDGEEVKRHQCAYEELSGLIDEAESLLNNGVNNEKSLRKAFSEAEDLIFDLDEVEYNLIQEIKKAHGGKND